MFKKLILLFLFTLIGYTSYSYPQFISKGYTSCITCHYNPLGGGPINDYGRKLGANTIASKDLYPKDWDDDKISSYSGFFFNDKKTKIKPHFNYRGLTVTNGFSQDDSQERFINMEAKIGATVLLTKNIIVNATISYLLDTSNGEDRFRSREHYVGYRSSKNWGVYVGFLDKAFGLRIPDHIAYSKATNGLAQNDQTHGAMVTWQKNNWNLVAHGFAGSLTQDSQLRQVGGSFRGEYTFNDKHVVGLSLLSSQSDIVSQSIIAVHSKLSVGKGSSLMFEFGRGERESLVNTVFNNSTYLFSQHHVDIFQGLSYFTTFEYLNASNQGGNNLFRLGAGLQYFPIQKVELRAELVNTRVRSSDSVQPDNWQLQAQVHLWL